MCWSLASVHPLTHPGRGDRSECVKRVPGRSLNLWRLCRFLQDTTPTGEVRHSISIREETGAAGRSSASVPPISLLLLFAVPPDPPVCSSCAAACALCCMRWCPSDPLAGLQLRTSTYHTLTGALKRLANELCGAFAGVRGEGTRAGGGGGEQRGGVKGASDV